MFDLYSDYLISSFWLTTATWMATILEWQIWHDKITRFLSKEDFDSSTLWTKVKPTVHLINHTTNVLIFDDSIEEKQYTDENDVICYHYDHVFWRNVKWVNILNCLLSSDEHDINIPIWYSIVIKPEFSCDLKTKRVKRQSKETKNEMLLKLFDQAIINQVMFTYVIYDSWFASNNTMKHIVSKGKHVVTELKSNRVIALNDNDRNRSKFVNIESTNLETWTVYIVYLKDYKDKVALVRQVFINKDGSTGERYLISTDTSLSFDQITSIYKRRWNIEESYKSTKSNASFNKSPTKTIRTQCNHFFMSIYSYFKLQLLSSKLQVNNFCLKSRLYVKAVSASYRELQLMKQQCNFYMPA